VRTPYGAEHWTSRSMAHLISNRVYLGEARSGEFVLPDAHEPLVDVGIWHAAQRPRSVRSASGTTLLAGLLRCAGCRYVMKPGSVRDRKGRKVRQYHCRGRRAAGDCGARAAVMGSVIEPWVLERYREAYGDVETTDFSGNVTEELHIASEAVSRAEAELRAYLEADIAATLGAANFRRGLEVRRARLEKVRGAMRRCQEKTEAREVAITVAGVWDQLDVDEQHQLLTAGIDAIFLRRVGQANIPVSDRALILWRGEAPGDLPGPGRRLGEIRPFEWPA
jgi:hypothetical protein